MNQYLVALIGTLALFVVSFITYAIVARKSVKESGVRLDRTRFLVMAVSMYIASLAFTVMYNATYFVSGVSGPLKGLYLGLLVGVPFFAIPLFTDAPYFKLKDSLVWTIIANWVVGFAVLGLVVGAVWG